MEHRWYRRTAARFDVVLYHHELPIARCCVHNLSANGMFVRPAAVGLEANVPVDLEFVVRSRNKLERYRIPAQVVHQSENGTGLMFQSYRHDVRQLVAQALDALARTVARSGRG